MNNRLVTVFGGSGFVGRYVVQHLARRGARIRVAVRHPQEALFLKPLGQVGQIHIVPANIRVAASVAAAVAGADAVINLVGILHQRGRQRFRSVHVDGARNVAEAAKAARVPDLLHLSALGADPDSPAAYARSKAAGEAAVRAVFPRATIFHPSVIFGPEDDFFNRFARLAKVLPFIPVIAGDSRFQPVYVGDVAAAAVAALDSGKAVHKETFALGGPRVYALRELLEIMRRETMLARPLVPVPMWLARLQAAFLGLLPDPPLTLDQLRLLARDTIVPEGAPGLAALGITPPTPLEAILPLYLRLYRPQGQFSHPAVVR